MIRYRRKKKMLVTDKNGSMSEGNGIMIFTKYDSGSTITIGQDGGIGFTAQFDDVYKLIRAEIKRELEAEKQGKNSEKYS